MIDEKPARQANPYWRAALSVADALGDGMFDRPLFRNIRRAAKVVDAGRQLKVDLREKNAALSSVSNHAKEIGLEPWGSSNVLDWVVFDYAKHAPTTVLYTSPPGDQLVEAALAPGSIFLCVGEESGRKRIYNLYHRKGQREAASAAIGDLVWQVEDSNALLLGDRVHWGDHFLSFDSIGDGGLYAGLRNGHETMLESVGLRAEKFREGGVSRRILLYGPPGGGKTTLARKLAQFVSGRLLQVPAKMVDTFGAHSVGQVLDALHPDVVLLDDIDRNPEGMTGLLEVLVAAGEARSQPVIVIGTVNAVEALDPALLRPGRFDETIEVAEPGPEYRRVIIDFYLAHHDVDLDADRLTTDMDGFAPADIAEVIGVCAVVGPEVYEIEVARVGRQRKLHSGDAVARFLSNQRTSNAGLGKPEPERLR